MSQNQEATFDQPRVKWANEEYLTTGKRWQRRKHEDGSKNKEGRGGGGGGGGEKDSAEQENVWGENVEEKIR